MTQSPHLINGAAMTRRDLLKAGVLGALVLPAMAAAPVRAASVFAVPSGAGAMRVSFKTQNGGETFSGVYRVGDRYLPEAFEDINHVLRDFRTGEVFPIDPRLMDIIFTLRDRIDTDKPFEVLSGYRSPKTNARLTRGGDGAAQNSLHMTGQAIDLRLPGFPTRKLYEAGANLKAGGAGYYGRSNFVHLDTGVVRRWS